MKNKPFQLRPDCVQYRVVELEALDMITHWAINCEHQGADIWFDLPNDHVWVIVPEAALFYFLDHYGSAVSAI